MAVPSWPAELPFALDPGTFGQSDADGRLRSATDTGPGKVRLLNSAAVTPVSAQLVPTTFDGRARFTRFWTEEIGRGAKPFLVRDPLLEGQEMTDENGNVLTDENGNHLVNDSLVLALFGQNPPAWTALGGGLMVLKFELNILP